MLNITYKDRMTNVCVREKILVIYIISNVREMKWSWAGHINRLKDDRWTSRVTTWRPCHQKRRQESPARRWRDDLDKYGSDTFWQMTAQLRDDFQRTNTPYNVSYAIHFSLINRSRVHALWHRMLTRQRSYYTVNIGKSHREITSRVVLAFVSGRRS